jgi:hypothetical protein
MGTKRSNRNEPLDDAGAQDGRPTLVPCPLCARSGLVTPEVAATFDRLAAEAKERT